MSKPLVFNVQRFSVHDGDGIRTSIFFKGCPLSCAWCHNPEGRSFKKELMFYEDRCTGCGACSANCPLGAVSIKNGRSFTDRKKCIACGKCVDFCIFNAREIVGEEIEVEKLAERATKDYHFYESSGGGVTLSGGEVMAQDMDYLLELLKILYKKGISVNIDTSGDVPYESLKAVLPYVDTFLYDIKALSPDIHKKYIGRSNERILDNLKRLNDEGAKINIRIPVIPGVNDGEEMEKIISFVREYLNPVKVNLLPYHKVGTDKAERIGKEATMQVFSPPSSEEMQKLADLWKGAGFKNVAIGG